MYVFPERHFDVNNYSYAISSIAFSKCTKFFNNCLIEPSVIITKSRAKPKVILSWVGRSAMGYHAPEIDRHFYLSWTVGGTGVPTK